MWKEFAEDEYSAAPRNELCLLDLVDTKPTLPAQVDSLTRQLGNDDSDTRDKAERSIIALGPRCLPLLAGGLKHPDPEIRRKAIFWLGQSQDPRAIALFEELLLK